MVGLIYFQLLFSALLVTGGYNENPETPYSAEVILPSGQSCSMPPIPLPQRQHTVSGWTVCGGMEIGTGNVLEP